MIFLYNETENTQWEINEKNNSFIRLENKNVVFGLDIFSSEIGEEDFDKSALGSCNTANKLIQVVNKPTVIRFNRRRLQPFVRVGTTEFNADIILASFDISAGERLINHNPKGVYIYAYHYDYENKQLHIIFTIDANIPSAYLELYFMSKDDTVAIMKCISHDKNTGNNRVIMRSRLKDTIPEKGQRGYINTLDKSTDRTKYDIRPYIPARPTYIFFIREEGIKEKVSKFMTETYKMNPEKTNFIVAETEEELVSTIKDLVKYHGYVGCTYFEEYFSFDQIKSNKSGYMECNGDIFRKYFNIVFAMCNDGRMIRLK